MAGVSSWRCGAACGSPRASRTSRCCRRGTSPSQSCRRCPRQLMPVRCASCTQRQRQHFHPSVVLQRPFGIASDQALRSTDHCFRQAFPFAHGSASQVLPEARHGSRSARGMTTACAELARMLPWRCVTRRPRTPRQLTCSPPLPELRVALSEAARQPTKTRAPRSSLRPSIGPG